MKGTLSAVLALVSIVLAVLCYVMYSRSAQSVYIIGLIIFIALVVVFGGMFLSGRVNKTEEIHITE